MTANELEDTTIERLRDRTRGAVLEPDDPGYDDARTIWNARIDRKPAAIVGATGVADVITGVNLARERDLPLSVKGGGHHVSGSAICDDGIVLDLGHVDGVRVDPEAKTAVVGPGATWGDVDPETQAFGLAVPGGQDPNIGVAGLTLGGGVGWLSRKYGLTCDNLLSADVVTADGNLVRASEDRNPDLFWALRGGGGNFGVVTAFEFQLHAVGPEILAGALVYPIEDAHGVARQYRAFMAGAPPEVRLLFGIMELPAVDAHPQQYHGERVAILLACYAGPPVEGERVLAPLRSWGDPVSDTISERSYTAFQRAGTSRGSMRTYLKSQYLSRLDDPVIETIVEYASRAPSSGATVFVSPRSGAETNPASNATAYPHRSAAHHLLIETRWSDPDRDDEHVDWTREFHEAVRPFTTGEAAANFLTDDENQDRVRAAYGDNADRLREVKREWDPENLFSPSYAVDPSDRDR